MKARFTCATVNRVLPEEERCTCGCECCQESEEKTPEKETEELEALRAAIDGRLTELLAGRR